jgi:branched-chain amino acid transport system permease protein
MAAGVRRERLDRGIAVRSADIFALASWRELAYLLLPGATPLLALLSFPLWREAVGPYWSTVVVITCAIALLALSWDLLASVGLVSLGQALFFGIGAYVAGWLNHRVGLPPAATIPVATVAGALFCALLLSPVLRLRGIYFALITFALPLLFMRVIEATRILGGTEGLSGLTPLPGTTWALYMAIGALLLTLVGYRRLIDSDFGLVVRGVRDNDRAVLAAGIDVHRVKAQVVFLAGLPGTFAGAFLTHHYQFVGMPAFALEYSVLPLTSAIVGGVGTFMGAVLGAFILVPLSEILRELGTLRVVAYSVALLVFVVGLPEGIFHYLRRKYRQFERPVPAAEERA